MTRHGTVNSAKVDYIRTFKKSSLYLRKFDLYGAKSKEKKVKRTCIQRLTWVIIQLYMYANST